MLESAQRKIKDKRSLYSILNKFSIEASQHFIYIRGRIKNRIKDKSYEASDVALPLSFALKPLGSLPVDDSMDNMLRSTLG